MNVLSRSASKTVKQRLVFGIFGHQAALVRALEDLAAKGFAREELCVSGTRDVLMTAADFAKGQAQQYPHCIALISEIEFYPPTLGVDSLVGTRGPLLTLLIRALGCAQPSESNQVSAYCKETTANLGDSINKGFMVLAVAISKPRQLTHASKILLQRSAHDVQTHELLM